MTTAAACELVGMPRARFYRTKAPRPPKTPRRPRPAPPRTIPKQKRQQILDTMNQPRFTDAAPAAIYATLLDEGSYMCSPRTMYRILSDNDQNVQRRQRPSSPPRAVPRLSADGPNQVWSWDITKLRGPSKGELFYLYVIIDIYSRYVVGWMLADCERAELAEGFIKQTCRRQGIRPDQLTLHADRGAAMRSQDVADLLGRLHVHKSHSRPYTPDDNPYSEAQFKTLKYHPSFPGHFTDLSEARTFCRRFFTWYNTNHHHSGIAMFTPATVHFGQVKTVRTIRKRALNEAYKLHPERFVNGPPRARRPPQTVWINKPENTSSTGADAVGAVDRSEGAIQGL